MMNKKWKLLIAVLCICAITGVVIKVIVDDKNPSINSTVENNDDSEYYTITSADYSWYESLSEICTKADEIINGIVVKDRGILDLDVNLDKNAEPSYYKFHVFDIEVIEGLGGALSKGDIIAVKMFADEEQNIESGYLIEGNEYVCFLETYEKYGSDSPACLLNPIQAQIIIENEDVVADDAGILFEDTKLKVTKKKGSKVSQGDRVKNGKKELLNNIRQHGKENKGKNKKK